MCCFCSLLKGIYSCHVTFACSNRFAVCKYLIELWQSCTGIFSIAFKIDLYEHIFGNCFASFYYCQHLIIEYKNQLEMCS